MKRILSAFAALAATSCLLAGTGTVETTPPRASAAVIGADTPIFLGRFVVTAAPLPANGD